jgi:hypothetical protein
MTEHIEGYENRRRRLDEMVVGQVIDPDSGRKVDYEAGVEPLIYLPSGEAVSPDEARERAAQIVAAANAAEVGPRKFEPGDRVEHDELAPRWYATVVGFSPTMRIVTVQEDCFGFDSRNVHLDVDKIRHVAGG